MFTLNPTHTKPISKLLKLTHQLSPPGERAGIKQDYRRHQGSCRNTACLHTSPTHTNPRLGLKTELGSKPRHRLQVKLLGSGDPTWIMCLSLL